MQLELGGIEYELFTFVTREIPLSTSSGTTGLYVTQALATGSSVGAKWSYGLHQTSYNAETDERHITFTLTTYNGSGTVETQSVQEETTVIISGAGKSMQVNLRGLPIKATSQRALTMLDQSTPSIRPLPT